MSGADDHGHWFYSPEAVDRIVDAAGRLTDSIASDLRAPSQRRAELEEALEFAADRFVGTFVGRLVQLDEGHQPAEPRGRGRPPQREIQEFLEALQDIWLDVFEGRLRTSRSALYKGTGPQVMFLDACRRELLDRLRSGPGTLAVFRGRTRPDQRREVEAALDKLTPSSIEARVRGSRSSKGRMIERFKNVLLRERDPNSSDPSDDAESRK